MYLQTIILGNWDIPGVEWILPILVRLGTVSGQKKTGTKMTTVQIQIWRTHTLYVILKTTQMGIF
jgi:hypothetical protein